MPNLSQIFKNGQALQANSGSLAIAQNDLLVLGGASSQLYPIQVSDYAAVSAAGTSAVALTTATATGSTPGTHNHAVVDPTDASVFIADTYQASQGGCQIWKYSAAGALLRNLILDATGTGNVIQLSRLSNGNLLVLWSIGTTPYAQYFAVVDVNFVVVVAKTLIANASTLPVPNGHVIALSAGGFAFAYAVAAVGVYFTVRANDGTVVYGPTLIAGAPNPNSGTSAGPSFKLIQLSDGNIFVGINDNQQADSMRYCIFTPAGAAVKAYTVLTGSGAIAGYPELSVLPGFVCIVASKAYVLNNAGTLQGGPATIAGTTFRVTNDGTYFWAFYSSLTAVRIPISGVTFITSTLTFNAFMADVFFERGVFVAFDNTNMYVLLADASGAVSVLTSLSFSASAAFQSMAVGDFCVLVVFPGKFQIIKYLSASIFGIAQTAVSAGNAGTPVTVNEGPGGYITNPIKGSVGKAFDHSSATIVGNKGAIFPTSTALKGI